MATNLELILAQIKTLGDNTNKNFDEVKGMMGDFDYRVRGIEKGEAGCQAVVAAKLDAHKTKLNEHTDKLKEIEKLIKDQADVVAKQSEVVASLIESQKQLKGILKWILGIATAIITAIFILLITGQAQVIFK